MNSHQALTFSRTGPPTDVLQLVDESPGEIASGQVFVKMLAAPINPSDRMFVQGNYGLQPRFPARVGFEGVGQVLSAGRGWLGKLMVGRRVAVLARTGGTWADQCVADAKSVVPMSKALPIEQAATYFINPATAVLLTRSILELKPGDWVVQSAAASAVGRMIINLSSRYGFKTLNIVRREEQIDELKRLGATEVLVASDEESMASLSERIRQRNSKTLPIAAIDCVGGELGSQLVRSLGPGGTFVSYSSLDEAPVRFDSRHLIVNDLRIRSFWLGRTMQSLPLRRKLGLLQSLKRLHQQGEFNVETTHSFPLSDYRAALDKAAEVTGGHKVLLRMDGE